MRADRERVRESGTPEREERLVSRKQRVEAPEPCGLLQWSDAEVTQSELLE